MIDQIKQSLQKAEDRVSALRKTNSRYIVISLVASVLATFLAGSTAFLGPLAGQGPPAWKWTCGITAIFTATATIFTGLHKQLSIPEKLSRATECAGKLRAIDFSLQNLKNESEKDDLLQEYRKVIEVYSEYVV
ncbi:MAG: hypothetical protein JNJ56_05755 [Ignavibacteria bacterium]|nr:hypothetical protein [Ignavibacteria bacterium]